MQFYGYGDIQTAWLADILPSKGQEAIDEQIRASNADNEVEVSIQQETAPAANEEAKDEGVAKDVTPVASSTDEKIVQQAAVVTATKTANDKPVEIKPDVAWKVDDFVRAFCKQLGEEREGQIHMFHPSKREVVKVIFLNTAAVNVKEKGKDIIEILNVSELKASAIQPATIDTVDGGANNSKNDSLDETVNTSSSSDASTVIEVLPTKKAAPTTVDSNNNPDNVGNNITEIVQSDINEISQTSSSGSDDSILQATKMLAEQLASAKVIEDLRKQLAERDKKLRIAEERNEVNEIIFREMRLANSQLQAENIRLKENEAKFHKDQGVLLKDIKSLLSKVMLFF